MERGVFGIDRLYGIKANTEVSPPPGLTLGDFGMKHVNRFSKKRNGVKLTNSYMALQCCEDESCVKCEVNHEGNGELREVFKFEREVNNVEKGYVASEWERVEVTADSGASDTVGPPEVAGSVPVNETEASRAGICYVTANGSKVTNMGEKRVKRVKRQRTKCGYHDSNGEHQESVRIG